MIVVESLTKTYGAVTAVRDLSFSVARGETFALVGPNGAGKTTTLKVLLGLARPDSGRVTIGPDGDGGLAIDVADNGRGIKTEDVSRVFEAYYQGDDGMALKKGIGLGLAIVRQLVEAHRGRVWAESEGEGKGCTFRVRIPKGLAAEVDPS